ncbi:hypothetical protein E2C01_033696 [Portunus trituberculatus]|uniref:Uncharacterized protein n=1 Tax=Portunus trituberculatus TaxID=210409 RepID=A0A5B7EZI0_PORTR|nr:hypothetical protein [Portunus trituberculatus]
MEEEEKEEEEKKNVPSSECVVFGLRCLQCLSGSGWISLHLIITVISFKAKSVTVTGCMWETFGQDMAWN